MRQRVTIRNKEFEILLSSEQIREAIQIMAKQIREDYKSKHPVYLGILNGCFIFMADLVRAVSIPGEISFIRISSYQGMTSTGEVHIVNDLGNSLHGRDVILVEDIVDSGTTLLKFLPELEKLRPASVRLASLLVKPEPLQGKVKIDYAGFEIPNKFVIGYGLDFDGLGRELSAIYQLAE